MPVPQNYRAIFQCGFRQVPTMSLPDFICVQLRVPTGLPITYDIPDIEIPLNDYIVIAPYGETTYKETFNALIQQSTIPVVLVGAAHENSLKADEKIIDLTGLGFLETAAWISKSKGFVGLMSAMLVLANGFNIPKVVPHDNKSWDMRHVVYSSWHHYLVNPTGKQIWNILNE